MENPCLVPIDPGLGQAGGRVKPFHSGQKVDYHHTYPGGYGYSTVFPAVVVRCHQATARIRLAREQYGRLVAFERTVTLARLKERSGSCSFETVLEGGL